MLFYTALFSFTMGVLAFAAYQVHSLNLLISLEAIMLSLLVFLYSFSMIYSTESHLFLVLLTLAACEGALGLSLLVSLLRLRGNDLVDSFSSMKF
uniref:NADH-ubiquinone oxidoreductase chain 4L n=1 Tax=Siphonaria pectinata TaxID=57642 RepID=B3DFE0_9GAST|nr:NADH dehydrogenase subunit 4L [Siphonaria pectinata]ACE62827.1 NADH dehydrogenase subunit 4L [Siphonaria pectinata]